MLEYTGSFFLPGFLSTAEVAELADALASGASSRKGVKVRVLSSAPTFQFNELLAVATGAASGSTNVPPPTTHSVRRR